MSDALEVSALCDTAKQFILGPNTSTLSMDGYLDADATADAQFDQLNDWKTVTAAEPVSTFPNTMALGSQAVLTGVYETQASLSSPNNGVVAFSMSGQADGPTDVGVSLADLTAITSTGNQTSWDNGAATTNGGVAHLHSTAFSGLTSNTVKIEHSTDNSSFSTLTTFTAVTGVTSQRLVVAPGTTVNRYLRVVDTVVGTGSNTRQVSFARR
jgi:hypothetical protein